MVLVTKNIPKTIQGSVTNVPKKPAAVRPITTAAATTANYGDNPYGSLGPSPGTVAKINALPTAAGGLGIAPAGPVVTPGTPGHWSDPIDYASMIPGDWQVTDAQAQGNKLTGEAEAAFQKSLRQAFIDYGGDSSKLGDYAKYIDQPTIDAAQANKFSTVAQNLAAMTKSLRQQRAALAARGIGSSGANTEMTRQALTAKEAADYQGMRSFLSGADQGTANLRRCERRSPTRSRRHGRLRRTGWRRSTSRVGSRRPRRRRRPALPRRPSPLRFRRRRRSPSAVSPTSTTFRTGERSPRTRTGARCSRCRASPRT
jgi:hypothetical protein